MSASATQGGHNDCFELSLQSHNMHVIVTIRSPGSMIQLSYYPPVYHSGARWMFSVTSVCLFVSLSVCLSTR